MALRENLLHLRDLFITKIFNGFDEMASWFGYPENPGMPLVGKTPYIGEDFFKASPLPIRQVIGELTPPENLRQVFLGIPPQVKPLERHFFQSTDGFYNFYIENYSNLVFLPNKLSEILQVKFGYCFDITFLEILREVTFVGLTFYGYLVSFRFLLGWFLTINPYTIPWSYLLALVDWIEDSLLGITPTIAGVNFTGTLFLTFLGKITDSLNHIVFTMPFLPSEGEPMKMMLNGELKDVLVFRYLPVLWYKYPIPNEIREFWYTQRPDILNYMETAYKNLDIRFLPDRFYDVGSQSITLNDLYIIKSNLTNLFSTNVLSVDNVNQLYGLKSQIIQNLNSFLN